MPRMVTRRPARARRAPLVRATRRAGALATPGQPERLAMARAHRRAFFERLGRDVAVVAAAPV